MFKKIISFMVVLSVFTATASAQTSAGLKAAFDDLNYGLTVEWDQKDQDFYDQQITNFKDKFQELRQQGLTDKELISFLTAELKDEQLAHDLETTLGRLGKGKVSEAEAMGHLLESSRNTYAKGAEWSGRFGTIAGYVVLVSFVSVAVWAVATGRAEFEIE